MIDLTVLGHVDLLVDEKPLRALTAQPKRLGLLVFLHLARPKGPQQRETIIGMFWPEQDQYHARQALNQSLYYLRGELGRETIRSSGRELVGILPGTVQSDVADFDAALDAGDLERALARYRGDLLPGFYLTGCPGFERWLEEERERLRQRARSALKDLIARTESQGALAQALHWARMARLQSPLDEGFLIAQLGLLARLGDTDSIRREFRSYEERLRDVVELDPSDDLRRQVQAALASAMTAPASVEPHDTESESPTPVVRLPHGPRKKRLRRAGSLAIAATVVAVGWYALSRASDTSGAPPLERRRVLVLPFESSSNPDFRPIATMASVWIAGELSKSGLVRVVIGESPSGNPIRSARQSRAGLMISGLVRERRPDEADLGAVLEAVIVETASNQVVGRVEPTVIDVRSPAIGLTEFGNRVAGSVVMAADFTLGDWTGTVSRPPDLESYRLFAAGLDAMRSVVTLDAADSLFLLAAGPDSSFTTPLVWAIRARADAHRTLAADSLARQLGPRRPQMTGGDAAMYDYYTAYLWSSWEEAYQAARRMAEIVPTADWKRLAAGAALGANRPGDALEILEETERDLGPWIRDWPSRWVTWAIAYHDAGRYEDERRIAAEWLRRDSSYSRIAEVNSLAGLGRWAELLEALERQLQTVEGRGARLRILGNAVSEIRAHGGGAREDRYAEMLVALVDSIHGADTSIAARFERARQRTIAGRYAEASALLPEDGGGPGAPDYVVKAIRGIAAASGGEEEEARSFARHLSVEPPFGAGSRTLWAARILATLGDREGATDLFRLAIERGHGFYPWLHTVREFEILRDYPLFQELIKPRN